MTGRECTMPTIQIWQLTQLTAPRQCLIHTNPRSAACAISTALNTRNRRKLHTACNPVLADHTTHRTTAAPDPHQSALRHMCHLYSTGLPPQCLVKLQFRDRLCIDTGVVQQPIMPGLRSLVCRLVKSPPHPPRFYADQIGNPGHTHLPTGRRYAANLELVAG